MWPVKNRMREWHSCKLMVYPGIQGRGVVLSMLNQFVELGANPFAPSNADPAWTRGLPVCPFPSLLPPAVGASAASSALSTVVGQTTGGVFPEAPPPTFEAVTAFVRRYQDAAIAWIGAALDAGVVTSDMVLRAVSDFTVGYAFSSFELRAVDSLATPSQRSTADVLLSRLLALPSLESWQGRPRSAHVHTARSAATRKVFADVPVIDNYEWWVTSQIPIPSWVAYDRVDATVFADDVLHSPPRAIESTCEVFGDDAGDIAVDHPYAHLREDLRVFEIESIADVGQLVERYPARFADADRTTRLAPEWAGIMAPIEFVIDWVRLGADYDGVRLSVPAALAVAYVPVRVETAAGHGTAMITGWTPGSTVYLVDPTDRRLAPER